MSAAQSPVLSASLLECSAERALGMYWAFSGLVSIARTSATWTWFGVARSLRHLEGNAVVEDVQRYTRGIRRYERQQHPERVRLGSVGIHPLLQPPVAASRSNPAPSAALKTPVTSSHPHRHTTADIFKCDMLACGDPATNPRIPYVGLSDKGVCRHTPRWRGTA